MGRTFPPRISNPGVSFQSFESREVCLSSSPPVSAEGSWSLVPWVNFTLVFRCLHPHGRDTTVPSPGDSGKLGFGPGSSPGVGWDGFS